MQRRATPLVQKGQLPCNQRGVALFNLRVFPFRALPFRALPLTAKKNRVKLVGKLLKTKRPPADGTRQRPSDDGLARAQPPPR